MSGVAPWRACEAAAPLRSWRDMELAQVALVLDAAWQSWARDWEVPVDPAACVVCRHASGDLAGTHGWRAIGGREQARAWVRWSGEENKHLGAAWFESEDANTPVVRDLVHAALDDLRSCLARALRLGECAGDPGPAVETFARWGGSVLAWLPLGGVLLLDVAVVDPLVPRAARGSRPPVIDVGEAVAANVVHLRVQLQGCELPISALQSLRAGDVLRLAHRVDAPATVHDAQGQVLFQGWLACSRGRRAVELAPVIAR